MIYPMNNKIVERIQKEADASDLVNLLAKMPSSDLNSLMMEVMREKTEQISPSDLMRNYTKHRFTRPANVNFLDLLTFEAQLLQQAQLSGFEPLELSPVSPLGACSIVATVNQDKVLSALRGTEVMADATNALALESTLRRRQANFPPTYTRLCTVHRHLRTPYVKPPFTAHFKIFCMVTGGRDTGSLAFEKQHLIEHIRFITTYLKNLPEVKTVRVSLKSTQSSMIFGKLYDSILTEIKGIDFIQEDIQQPYYKHLQFKVLVTINEVEYEIADGGMVDWSQKLANNHKERMVTSGIGIELLLKLCQSVRL